MAERVTIFEVGPRDGLQNEPRAIATDDKVRLIDLLSRTGLSKIEATSFVSPKWVPQMEDASAVMAAITRAPGLVYAALAPNERGLEAAIAAKVDEVAVFASASDGFSRANINCSIEESLARFSPVIAGARRAGLPVRGYVSCITDCPYDGPVAPEDVSSVAGRLLEMGCYEVSLGDTLGRATPDGMDRLLEHLVPHLSASRLAAHFHDTSGRALDNVDVALARGIRTFDASVAGLGGCPYAPGAKGNVATEAVNARLRTRGFETGVDPALLAVAVEFARTLRSIP